MFKTVRAQHGTGHLAAELEYTVLPQSDDRSLSSASSGEEELPPCASDHQHRHHHQQQQQYQYHQNNQPHHHHHHRRTQQADGTRRTVIIILAMLVVGCGVVAAAVLVPILLATRLVSVPSSARLQTFAVAASGVIHSARGDYVQLLPVKHAPPGTVIEFEPIQEQPRPPSAANRRKRRSTAAAAAGGQRPPPFPDRIDRSRRRIPIVGFPELSKTRFLLPRGSRNRMDMARFRKTRIRRRDRQQRENKLWP